MSANQHLIESQVRHQIFLLRRGGGMAKDLVPVIQEILRKVAGDIATTPDQLARQRAMIQEIEAFLLAATSDWSDELLQESLELAAYEAGFQQTLLNGVATVDFAAPAAVQLAQAVEFSPSIQTKGQEVSLRSALDQYDRQIVDMTMQTIRDGIVQQKTNAEISKDVQAIIPLQKQRAESLVRTAANASANVAKEEFNKQNSEFLKGERFLNTLDIRTTKLCIEAGQGGVNGDGIYPVGVGPKAPQHYNCRSLRVSVLADEYQLPGFEGERPAVGADGPGVIGANTTYAGFLRMQPVEFQDEVLGRDVAKLWRAGKIDLKRLTDPFGRPLTAEELEASAGV